MLIRFWLELGTVEALQAFLGSFVSFTTDMGTDVNDVNFICDQVKELLPYWLRDPAMRPDVDEFIASIAEVAVSLFMPNALVAPGALHILSNLNRLWTHI